MKIYTCEDCGAINAYSFRNMCRKCYHKKYQIENKEKIAKQKKKYRNENKEKVQKQERESYYRRRESIRMARKKSYSASKQKKYNDKYYQKNKEKINAQSREYYKNNREELKNYQKQYRQTPAGKLTSRRIMIKKRGAGVVKRGDLSKLLNENIFKYGIITCEKCKQECEDNYHIDHIVPISKGGKSNYANLQILCPLCNYTKRVDIINYKNIFKDNQLFLGMVSK